MEQNGTVEIIPSKLLGLHYKQNVGKALENFALV